MLYPNHEVKHRWFTLYLLLSLILMVQIQATSAISAEIQASEIQAPHHTIAGDSRAHPQHEDSEYSRNTLGSASVKDSPWDGLGNAEWLRTDEPFTVTYDLPAAPDLTFYTPHAPIVIEENSDFEAFPGEGTPGDPYVISGLEIYITYEDACIKISNTDVHFEIRDCYLHSNSTELENIELNSVSNGLVTNNTCMDSEIGILLNNSDHITIDDNTCGNQSRACIYLSESHDITADNNSLVNGWSGIYLEKSNYNTIENNEVSGCEMGIDLYWLSDHNTIFNNNVTANNVNGINVNIDCTDNLIDNNTLVDNLGQGIRIDFSDRNTIVNNTCDHNYGEIWVSNSDFNIVEHNYLGSTAASEGLYLTDSNFTLIRNNTFFYIEYCLFVAGLCFDNQIIDNNFTFFDVGISATYGGNTEIIGNYFDGYGYYASVLATGVSGILIQDNSGRNSRYGFEIESGTDVQVADNWCQEYSDGSIVIANSNYSVIEDNLCELGDEGIGIYESHDVIVDNNTVYYHNSDSPGIHLFMSNSSDVIDNIVGFGITGILVEYSFFVDIIGNEVFENIESDTGIHVSHSEYCLISENNCTANQVPSIYLVLSQYCTVTKNTINNTIDGIVLVESDHSIVTDNVITFGKGYGIGIWTSDYNTISNNHVANISGWEGWALCASGIENVFTGNLGCNSTYGFYIEDANECVLSHSIVYGNEYAFLLVGTCENATLSWNIFEDNLQNGVDQSVSALIDYNYWSNYTGIDANADGIGDTWHPIDGLALNNDTHPLVYYPTLPTWTEEPTDQTAEYRMSFSYTLSLTMSSKLAPISEWWLSGTSFVIDDGAITNDGTPDVGVYPLEVRAYNLYGFYLSGFFTVTVEDTIAPTVSSPDDFSYVLGTTGHLINWNPDDLGPSSYSLRLDGVVVMSGAWNSTLENITYLADGLSVGEHTFALSVTDIGGSTATDAVLVTVLPSDGTVLLVMIGVSGAIIAAIVIVYLARRKGVGP